MRRRAVFMLLTAFVMAGSAVILARGWLERQVPQVIALPAAQPQPAMTTVVVAKLPLRFGDELNRENLGVINWPADAAPAEGFTSVDEVLSDKERRVALRDIGVNELVLKGRISGFGGRATLSALVGTEMRAITVRVNDVQGVAGFVLPGEKVDVIFTRPADAGSGGHAPPITDLLLQNVKVLAVDQIADNLKDKPVIAKAVTLEVSTEDAQKLTLAAQVGNLSLALRNFSNVSLAYTETVTVNNLLSRPVQIAATEPVPAEPAVAAAPPPRQSQSVRIFRGTSPSEQEVDREAKPRPAQAPQPATRRDAGLDTPAAKRTAVNWTAR